ncbi:MAG TPA: hypothetical protein VN867_06040 [Candidatus Binataceae bacterium]|nr:hypothetical protein [Candidatus Binataceae bacterium]
MKGSFQVVLSTIVLFVAGLTVGIWTQRSHALPPPPFAPMGEFDHFHNPGLGQPGVPSFVFRKPHHRKEEPTASELSERLNALTPEISAFQGKIDIIEQQFRDGLRDALRPEQQQRLEAMKAHLRDLPNPMPGCAPQMGPVFISMVIYRPLYDHLTDYLSLDSQQQKKLKELLTERRKQLLALIDDTPPPSFALPELVGTEPQVTDEGD